MKNRKTSWRSITVQISFLTQNIKLCSVNPKLWTLFQIWIQLIVQCGFNLTLISNAYQLKLKQRHSTNLFRKNIDSSVQLKIWTFKTDMMTLFEIMVLHLLILLRKVYVEVFHVKEVLLAFYFDHLKTFSALLGIRHRSHSIADCHWIHGGLYSLSDAEKIVNMNHMIYTI